MHGKILKVSSNDLYGNADNREVVVFAVFNHLKYMNKYIIFAFKDQYSNKKLYYGSVHVKDNGLVSFAVGGERNKEYITKFVGDYINNKLDSSEYEILDISDKEKIELVSYSEMDFDRLDLLDELSIKKESVNLEELNKKKKPVFLYVLLVLVLLLAGVFIYLHYHPELLTVKLNKLDCTGNGYDKKLELNYESKISILFDKNNKLRSSERIDDYKFITKEDYDDFKDNDKELEYFKIDAFYKYIDEELVLRIIIKDDLIIDDYGDVLKYYKNEGYSCIEGNYYE